MAPWEDYLKTIYYDPSHPASYGGPQKLYKVVQREGKYKLGMYRIRRFLQNQESYSLHKPVRRRFQRNHVISAGTDDLWMADLMDMVKYAKWNRGYKYVLLIIDTFSKTVWLRPLKSKTGGDVATAFQDVFTKSGRTPSKLITDKGQEFLAKKVQVVMKEYGIKYFPTQNETKASTSERAILTIKTKLNRYFTHKEDYEYLPVLQSMADSYNQTYHRTIDMAPADVNEDNQETVRLSTYFAQSKNNGKLKTFKYKIGDYVRISHLKHVFSRAYDETYTGETFLIYKRYHRGTIPIYRLKDMNNEEIKGTFYQSELQKVDIKPDQIWKIERVLKTVGRGRNKRLYVKWKNFPSQFNSFIKTSDIQ